MVVMMMNNDDDDDDDDDVFRHLFSPFCVFIFCCF